MNTHTTFKHHDNVKTNHNHFGNFTKICLTLKGKKLMVYTWAPSQNGLRVPNCLKWQFLQPDNYVQNSVFKNICHTAIKFSKAFILMTNISHLPGLEILLKLYSLYKMFFAYFLLKQKRERENKTATISNGCPQPIKRKIL